MSILDRRLIVVTGKGGVGRTAVASALGLAVARSGRRALVVEVAAQRQVAALFGASPRDPFAETPLVPNLSGLSIDPQRALEEYLMLQLRVPALAQKLAESRAFGAIAAAAPGLREVVTLGKVWHLAEQLGRDGRPRYDVIVLDAPATGHGIGLLQAPRAFAEIARVGRVHDESRRIAAFVADPTRTAVVLVTRPEEMPVNETIDATRRLGDLDLAVGAVVVNGVYPDRFDEADLAALHRATPSGETGEAAIRAALSTATCARDQAAERARLAEIGVAPLVDLPFLFRAELDGEGIGTLAERLAAGLEERAA